MPHNQGTGSLVDTHPEAMIEQGIALAKAGALDRAADLFRRVVETAPQNPDGWHHFGAVMFAKGAIDESIEYFHRALSIEPSHREARATLFNTLCVKMNQAIASGDSEGQLSACRQILALDPGNFAALINLHNVLRQFGDRAELGDFSNTLTPERIGRKIFVACMPKSGSSWLMNALTGITGFPEDRYAQAFLQNEQEICFHRVVKGAESDGVIQQHARATGPNIHVLQAFGIEPVVLVRNLFDALVSMHDFYDAGAVFNTFHYDDWADLDADTRLDLIVDCVAPWYVQFYASWVLAEREGRLRLHWLDFETMIADKPAALAGILEFLGIPETRQSIDGVVARLEGEKGKTRFNKGVAGRGEQTFSADQKARIRKLARYYPSVDFSSIGL